MTSERDDLIERLCHAALACEPAARAAFLAAECGGDEALRLEVASLLPHDAAVEQFMHVPALDIIARRRAATDGEERFPWEGVHTSNAVALASGDHFGAYTVRSVIGTGGMSEVYRARDPRLHRDVALKVLPQTSSRDVGRLARFEREAHILAALNHPNIATIHGIEHVDGMCALVLEVVEGETLAARLRSGPLPVQESLEIAYQIAGALEAAHERGIVHRDLKPANVMVTPAGRVKILDFGVAKVFDREDTAGTAAAFPNEATAATQPGLVLGTVPYMSPEQARGDVIDRRSDIWAFGCVLFEMLTGRSPFWAPTVAQTLANVLDGQPDLDALPPDTPAATRRLVCLCLERSPEARLQHIGHARVDIDDVRARDLPDRPLAALPRLSRRRLSLWMAAGATLVTLAGVFGWVAGSRLLSRGAAPVVRFGVTAPGGVLTPTARSVAISPDGSRLAYVAGSWLWMRQLGEMDATRVPGSEGSGGEPFFSPDGEWVAFFELNTGLRKVRVQGGAPQTIAVNAGRQLGGSWGNDGTIVFADGVGLFTVAAAGGAPTLLASPAAERGEVRYAWPQILPGGHAVLFTIVRDTMATADIAVIDRATRQQKVLVRGGHASRYLATGHLIYAAGGQLHAALFDADALELLSTPIALDSVRMAESPGAATANFDVSATGILVYVPAMPQPLRTLVWVDRRGREEHVRTAPRNYIYPRISPDATRVALDIGGANRDIWVWNFDREVMTRITDGPTEDMMPVWSVDSQRLFFASDTKGVFAVFSRSADGAGPARQVYRGSDNYMPFSSPDNEHLLVFTQGPSARSGDISILRLREPTQVESLVSTQYREGNAQVSADGHWITYQSNESGNTEIYIRSFPDIGRRSELVSRGGGTEPLWGPAGSDELFYRALDGMMRAVTVKLTPNLAVGATTDLFSTRGYAGNAVGSWAYSVSPRDGRFLMLKDETADDRRPINIVVNWVEELKRLVPAA